jgi:RES domain-containing protein
LSSPRFAYRIASGRHPLLDGMGALRYGARWNSPGLAVVYAAESYAGALLEMLVHANTGRLPADLVWVRLSLPENVEPMMVELPEWNTADFQATRAIGDAWLRSASLVLSVPSVVTNGVERNYAINPRHPDFPLIAASEPKPVVWDTRLLKR